MRSCFRQHKCCPKIWGNAEGFIFTASAKDSEKHKRTRRIEFQDKCRRLRTQSWGATVGARSTDSVQPATYMLPLVSVATTMASACAPPKYVLYDTAGWAAEHIVTQTAIVRTPVTEKDRTPEFVPTRHVFCRSFNKTSSGGGRVLSVFPCCRGGGRSLLLWAGRSCSSRTI